MVISLESTTSVLALIIYCGLWYLMYKFLCVFEKWVDYYGRRKEIYPTTWVSGATQNSIGFERQENKTEFKVPELAPEVIAPHLRRPPKSSGFGISSDSDRDGQSEQSGDQKTCGGSSTLPKAGG